MRGYVEDFLPYVTLKFLQFSQHRLGERPPSRQTGRTQTVYSSCEVSGFCLPYAIPLACWAKKTCLACQVARLLDILKMGKGHVTLSHQGR